MIGYPAKTASLLALFVAGLVVLAGCETAYRSSPRPAMRSSTEVAPGQVVVGQPIVEPWEFRSFKGELVTTSTHRLHMTLPPGRLRDEVPMFMEKAVGHYQSMITNADEDGVTLPVTPDRLDVFLFGEREEWADWTRWRLGRDARLYLKIELGGYTIDSESVLFDIGRVDTLCLLAHEGWHQYTQAIFKHPLPVWLEEGLATYAEGHRFRRSDSAPIFMPWRNLERYWQLRIARREGRMIGVDELLDRTPQEFVARGEKALLTYYAQVWVMAHYLMEGRDGEYRAGLAKLVRDAAEGHITSSLYDSAQNIGRRGRNPTKSMADAIIAAYFDQDVLRFKLGYNEFLEKVLASGSGMYVWRGLSPVLRE